MCRLWPYLCWETNGSLNKRISAHRHCQINNCGKQILYKNVNSPERSILTMKIRILKKIYQHTYNVYFITKYTFPDITKIILDQKTGYSISSRLQRQYQQCRKYFKSTALHCKCDETLTIHRDLSVAIDIGLSITFEPIIRIFLRSF